MTLSLWRNNNLHRWCQWCTECPMMHLEWQHLWWVSTTMMHQFYWFQLRNIRMTSLRFEAESLDSACSAIKPKMISFGGDALEILYRIFLPGISPKLWSRTTHWHGAHFICLKYQFRYKCALQKKVPAFYRSIYTALEFIGRFPISFFSWHQSSAGRFSKPRTLLFEDAQVEALHELGDQNPQRSDSVIKGGVFASSGALTLVRSNLTVPWESLMLYVSTPVDSQKTTDTIYGDKWIKFPSYTYLQPWFLGFAGVISLPYNN